MNRLHLFLTEATTQAVQDSAGQTALTDYSQILNIVMTVMLLGCGIYGLYTVIKLRRTYLLFPNKFLYPGGCKPEDCLDGDGFIDYILPRLTVLSIVMLILGIAFALNTYVFKITNWWIDIATILLPFGTFVWYIFIHRKAAKDFWNL